MDDATAARMLALIQEQFGMVVPVDMRAKLRDVVHALHGDTTYHDAEALCSALLDNREADLLEAIAAQLTVPETHFFRVAPQIAALRAHVLPTIIRTAEPTHHLRLWSAGCSTGEEPYTL